MPALVSRAVRIFMHVCLHAQTAVDAGGIRTWQIIGKPKFPELDPYARRKMVLILESEI